MFLKKSTCASTENYSDNTGLQNAQSGSDNIKRLREEMETADAILIGARVGMSVSAGLTYSGERFYRYFSDFHAKFGINDIYSGGFYPYDSLVINQKNTRKGGVRDVWQKNV